MANSSRRPLGFTLVELLVVITIIGMLVALLLPAVQAVRESGRQTQCSNNLRQIVIATANYESSRQQLPGYSQLVKRGTREWATVNYDIPNQKFVVISETNLNNVTGLSWGTMLLARLERQDIWDQIVQPPRDGSGNPIPVQIPAMQVFVCPSDTDAASQASLAGLSYSGNTGAWDRDQSGNFLVGAKVGDTVDNGVFIDAAEYERNLAKAPKTRISSVKDGASTTLMYVESRHKSYTTGNPADPPLFSWLFGTEQQLGAVWVVNTNPQPGNTLTDQEQINGNAQDLIDFDPTIPRFARPASPHNNGFYAAFCDSSVKFVREDIEYYVYQQLMTANGRKCVDPRQHDPAPQPILDFRAAPPLAEDSYL